MYLVIYSSVLLGLVDGHVDMGEEQAKPCVGSSASKAFEFIRVVRGEKESRRGGGGKGGMRELETDRQSYTKRQRERGGMAKRSKDGEGEERQTSTQREAKLRRQVLER